jgi:hypothetical protein
VGKRVNIIKRVEWVDTLITPTQPKSGAEQPGAVECTARIDGGIWNGAPVTSGRVCATWTLLVVLLQASGRTTPASVAVSVTIQQRRTGAEGTGDSVSGRVPPRYGRRAGDSRRTLAAVPPAIRAIASRAVVRPDVVRVPWPAAACTII